jgi:hypothetical protein
MARGRRVKWGHPLIVGVAVAIIGALGAISAALISSSDSSDQAEPPTPTRNIAPSLAPEVAPEIAIREVDYEPSRDGKIIVLVVHGTAHGLTRDDVLYAIARPSAVGLVKRSAVGGSSMMWFASAPTRPRAGVWLARIRVGPPPRPFTVETVQTTAERVRRKRKGSGTQVPTTTLTPTTTTPPTSTQGPQTETTPATPPPPTTAPPTTATSPAPHRASPGDLRRLGPAAPGVGARSRPFSASPD